MHLVRRGRRVAIATLVGDDDYGDSVVAEMRQTVEGMAEKDKNFTGDLISCFVESRGSTRRSIVVTYGGKRTICDYDGKTKIEFTLAQDATLSEWRDVGAVYLGRQFAEFHGGVLKYLTDVKWRFFESGTRGPKNRGEFDRVLKVATWCNYVLASAEFVLKLIGDARPEKELLTAKCQQKLFQDVTGKQVKAKQAYKVLWNDRPGCVLVIVLGGYGSSVVFYERGTLRVKHVPRVDPKEGISWLGCGDTYRAEFIHQTLGKCKRRPIEAARRAAKTVADRIEEPLSTRNERKG
jgi:sugar/nucleoside kinase (ribokinase family)